MSSISGEAMLKLVLVSLFGLQNCMSTAVEKRVCVVSFDFKNAESFHLDCAEVIKDSC